MTTDNSSIHPDSGNVFEDLGLPDADGLLAKAEIVSQITERIEKLDRAQSAELLRLPEPQLAALLRCLKVLELDLEDVLEDEEPADLW